MLYVFKGWPRQARSASGRIRKKFGTCGVQFWFTQLDRGPVMLSDQGMLRSNCLGINLILVAAMQENFYQ